MLKLKLQYFGRLMRRVDSLEKTLMLGGIGGRRRRGRQRMRWLDGITDSMDVSLSELGSWWWTGRPGVLRFMGSQRHRHDWATELNWTQHKNIHISICVHICKYIYTCLHLCVCVCVYVYIQLREKHPHLSIGNTFEDTGNKLDTSYSRELQAALMIKITRMEK